MTILAVKPIDRYVSPDYRVRPYGLGPRAEADLCTLMQNDLENITTLSTSASGWEPYNHILRWENWANGGDFLALVKKEAD